jgi:hypothetical protein
MSAADWSFWIWKLTIVEIVVVGVEWIHYRDFHGRDLTSAILMLIPYVSSLAIPRRWLGPAIAIPIGAFLVLSGPLGLSLAFIAGYKMDSGTNLRLSVIFISITIAGIAAVIAGILNRTSVRQSAFVGGLITSVMYYAFAVYYQA